MNPVNRAASSIRQDLPLVSLVEAQGDILNPDTLGDDVTVHVPAHALLAPGTVVSLYLYGSGSDGSIVGYEDSQQVDSATLFPLVFIVPTGPILNLTGGTVTFDYQVETFDGTGPHFSPPRHFQVRAPQALPPPVVQEAQGEWLDPADVDARTGAHVQLNWPGMAVNDRLTLTWRGSATGDFLVQRTIRVVGVQVVQIPINPQVVGNQGGTVEVSYGVVGGSGGASSRLRLNIGSGVQTLPAPTLDGASSGYLDPGKVHFGASARLPTDLTLQPGDTVRMYFGDSLVEGDPPEFVVLPNQIGQVLGQTVALTYRLTRNGVESTSEPLSVQVGRFDQEDSDLPMPFIPQATSDSLDLATFTGDATVGARPWPMAVAGQYVWLEVHGTANGAAEVIPLLDAHILTAQEAAYGLDSVPLPRSALENLDNGSTIQVKLWAAFDGSPYKPQAVLFPVRRYTLVREPAIAPTIVRVRGASGNVPNGGTTQDTTLTLNGTAAAGKQLEIFDGAVSKGIVDVDASGAWTLRVNGLRIGNHRFSAKALYGSNPVSGDWRVTISQRLTIDTSPLTLSGRMIRIGTLPTNPPSGTVATRTASGGTPPYRYSSSSNAVDIDANTGRVISRRNGQSTITVSDASAQRASYTVNVSNVLEIDGWTGKGGTYSWATGKAAEQGGRVPTLEEWRLLRSAYGGSPIFIPSQGDFAAWSSTSAGFKKYYTIVPNTGAEGAEPDVIVVIGNKGVAACWAIFRRAAN